jgi:C4-dicarboxylate-specific signal transduction histidine kinase
MAPDKRPETRKDLLERNRDLQARLEEAEETLRALRDGEVDAIVASGPDGDRIYTLKGADDAYRIMVEEMGEGALTLSLDGLILFSNDHFAAMLRRPLERVIGEYLEHFFVPEDTGLVSALLRGAGRRKAEVRLRTDDAASIPVYVSVQNVLLSGTGCLCVIVSDLSDQKRYAEIAAVLEAVPVGVFIAQDAECRSIFGNQMAYELLRAQPASNLSSTALQPEKPMTWRAVKNGRDIPSEELPMQIAARTGKRVRDYELDILFDDGVCRCGLGNAVPLFDQTGQSRGAVGAFIDITERRRTTEALEAANDELRSFGNALTHDIRAPLSTVVKSTRLLAEKYRGRLGEDAEASIPESVEAALRIETLLKTLLAYWNVTERSGVNLSSVDCNQMLSRTLQHFQVAIQESGATVTSDTLPTLVADELMLEEVFRTLIGNAIQYRGEAAPSIHISAVPTFDRWLFSVRDNGLGIDPKNAEQVFAMFKRLHGSEIPGTGLGLTLCRKIVERHGGRIWVEPGAEGGAAFRFTIPISLDTILGVSSPEL